MVGAITSATNMLNLGDSMILGMAVPNLFGAVLLSGKIRAALDDYLGKLKSGELFGIRS
jgi:AGCS family alanine or glycine:cation symporter